MADVRTLKLNLLADVDQFGKSLTKADNDTKSFSNKIGGYGKAMAKSFAVAGVAAAAYAVKLGVDSVKAAAEDEAAATKLAGTLKNVVGATDATIESTEKFITSMQMATGVSDNDLRKGMARLVRSTKDVAEAQKLSTLALDISAATGKDYTAVAEALAKANDGNTKALKRLGITLGDNAQNAADLVSANKKLEKAQTDLKYAYDNFGITSEEYVKAQEKVVSAQDKVNVITAEGVDWVGELSKEFAGSASKQAKTYAGQLAILQQTFGELQESVGAKFIPILKRLAEQTIKVSRAFSGEDPDGLSARARELQGEVGDGGAGSLGRSLKILADSFGKLFGELSSSQAGDATSTMEQMAQALTNVANAVNAIATAFKNYKKFYDKVPKGLKDFMNPISRIAQYADLFGGAGRAAGGSVMGGQAYRVGEFGPETFVPSGSGSIRPANGGGDTIINLNGIVDAESARRSIERLLQNSSKRTGAINLAGSSL